jgi:hypothetical protein
MGKRTGSGTAPLTTNGLRPSGTRVEAIVLRTVGPQGSLFELLLPSGMRVLSGELAEIDALLDDQRFFRPFRPFFDPVEGRPSIPIETYLRLYAASAVMPRRAPANGVGAGRAGRGR